MKRELIVLLFTFLIIGLFGASFVSADINDGLVGHWTFDEGSGTIASDFSGNGNTGTLTNGLMWGTGKFGSSVIFSGNNNNINIPSSTSLSFTRNMTVSVWVKINVQTSGIDHNIIGKAGEYKLGLRSGYFGFYIGNSIVFSNGDHTTGQWYLVTGVLDANGTAQIYIDGILQRGPISGLTSNLTIMSTTNPLLIGGAYVSADIDEVRMYNRRLSSLEVSQLFDPSQGSSSETPPNQNTTPPTTQTPNTSSSTQPRTLVVDQNGGGDFTTIQACANAVKPGDICLVKSGVYDEHVITTQHGTSQKKLTFKTQGTVVMKGFEIYGRYTRVEGFDITKHNAGVEEGHISVKKNAWRGYDGSYCEIVGNYIHDGIYIEASDLMFKDNGASGDTVTSAAGGFLAAGFKPGMIISITSPSASSIANNKNGITIKFVTDTTITFEGAVMNEGPVYAILARGAPGIYFPVQDGNFATNCLVQNNKIHNLYGQGIVVTMGENHLIEGNDISRVNGFDFLILAGNDITIRYNYLHDSSHLAGNNDHADVFQHWGLNVPYDKGFYNIVFEKNFVSNFKGGQIMQVEQLYPIGFKLSQPSGQNYVAARKFDITFKNNVFANIELGSSVDFPNVQFVGNTFFRSAYSGANPVQFGKVDDRGDPKGSVVMNNVFLESGSLPDPNGNRGWYGSAELLVGSNVVVSYPISYANYNYVAGPGYASKLGFSGLESNGINGQNTQGQTAKLANIDNLLGPDEKPFTSDDGLKPIAGSALCGSGRDGVDIGAYICAGGSVNRAGDINNDNTVNIFDLVIIVNDYGKSSGFDVRVDLIKDNFIDLKDIVELVKYWGRSY